MAGGLTPKGVLNPDKIRYTAVLFFLTQVIRRLWLI
jgi:hypothetical protein